MGNNDKLINNGFENFEKIFEENFSDLVRFALTIVNSQAEAEDIVQEVFIKIWESKKNKTFHKNLKGYLFISVKNASLNYIKKDKMISDKVNKLVSEAFDLYDTDAIDNSERNRLIFEAIEKLPSKGKVVLKLICFNNLKYKEVAEELNISTDTVKYHFTQSLKKLRKLLTKDVFIFFLQISGRNINL